ncbi:uncharacterized protein N7529_011141 [Penicillium soppii]|uniref:uncharacterized protein n=1 Tax=Penicillium soppii TaxID=69789 RepID=UPI0025468F46|nr:uncharacterized protein N7529_011141 [Penicillium soppii]KAJ5851756.1 hypothetical protein N7529_011141 [Penicillium soppii]
MRLQSLTALTLLQALPATTTQLFNFTNYVDIENSQLRPNGHLLLTTFNKAQLYTLNPYSPTPQAELIAALPGATALTGIAQIAYDRYAVVGGVRGSYHYDNETLYAVDLNGVPRVDIIARIPDAEMLNGMAALPWRPDVVLIADSRLGRIFRVDTRTGVVEVVFEDQALAAPANATLPIGINGLQVFGEFVFFTNSARNTFARIPVSGDGRVFGSVEVVAKLDAAAGGDDWDDFAFDGEGNAYVAQPGNAIARIGVDGIQSIVAGGGDSLDIIGPTSVQIAPGGKWAYVTTRGGEENGYTYSGQVVAVRI